MPSPTISHPSHSREGELISLPILTYPHFCSLQEQLVRKRQAKEHSDMLLLLEHTPVYTVGRSGFRQTLLPNPEELLPTDIPFYHVKRGGSITYHGPGQLMGYPILFLRHFCPGPRHYVHLLEEVLIRTLAQWGISGRRQDQLPGVWVGHDSPAKIACIGVHISRGVTMHGFALNANVDLFPFTRITPCGNQDCQMTSMKNLLQRPIPLAELRQDLARIFGEVFDLSWTSPNNQSSHDIFLDQRPPFPSDIKLQPTLPKPVTATGSLL